MSKILVVEDEVNTSELLRRYFEIVGYDVVNARNGKEAVAMAEEHSPQVIILDINLPDMDGYEVCRKLRVNPKTDTIPIIFLTQRDHRDDRLEGLRLGADDYIGKPFDVEELRLRVHNIIANTGGVTLVDPRTSLPTAALIKERLPKLLDDADAAFFDVTIEHFEAFRERYGVVAANQVLRSTAKMISDALHEAGGSKAFIGHPQDNQFSIGAKSDVLARVKKMITERFENALQRHYESEDIERGHMLKGEKKLPLMALAYTDVSRETLLEQVKDGD